MQVTVPLPQPREGVPTREPAREGVPIRETERLARQHWEGAAAGRNSLTRAPTLLPNAKLSATYKTQHMNVQ
jgi:hypothetical protein